MLVELGFGQFILTTTTVINCMYAEPARPRPTSTSSFRPVAELLMQHGMLTDDQFRRKNSCPTFGGWAFGGLTSFLGVRFLFSGAV